MQHRGEWWSSEWRMGRGTVEKTVTEVAMKLFCKRWKECFFLFHKERRRWRQNIGLQHPWTNLLWPVPSERFIRRQSSMKQSHLTVASNAFAYGHMKRNTECFIDRSVRYHSSFLGTSQGFNSKFTFTPFTPWCALRSTLPISTSLQSCLDQKKSSRDFKFLPFC